MSKSAHALGVCRLFSYTISLVSLGEAILSLSISMGQTLQLKLKSKSNLAFLLRVRSD